MSGLTGLNNHGHFCNYVTNLFQNRGCDKLSYNLVIRDNLVYIASLLSCNIKALHTALFSRKTTKDKIISLWWGEAVLLWKIIFLQKEKKKWKPFLMSHFKNSASKHIIINTHFYFDNKERIWKKKSRFWWKIPKAFSLSFWLH